MPDEIVVKISTQAELRAAQETAQRLEQILSTTRQNDSVAKEYKATLDALNQSIAKNNVAYAQEAANLQQVIQYSQQLGVNTTAMQSRLKELQESIGGGSKPTLFAQMKSDLLGIAEAVPGVGNLLGATFKAATGPVGAFTVAIGAAHKAMSEFSKTELIWARLDSQLARSGQLFDGTRQKYQALVEGMTDKTLGTSDNEWTNVTMRMLQFGRTTDQVGKDMEVIRGIMARTGSGVEHAQMIYERALNGSFYALQRFGVMIPQHATQMEKMAALYREVGDGAAYFDEMGKTNIGTWDTMKTGLERLTETVGKHLNDISPLPFLYKKIGDGASDLAKVLGGGLPDAIGATNAAIQSAAPSMMELRDFQIASAAAAKDHATYMDNMAKSIDDYVKKLGAITTAENQILEVQKAQRINQINATADIEKWSDARRAATIAGAEGQFSKAEYQNKMTENQSAQSGAEAEIGNLQIATRTAKSKLSNDEALLNQAKSAGDTGATSRYETIVTVDRKAFYNAAEAEKTGVPAQMNKIKGLQSDAATLQNTYAGTENKRVVDAAKSVMDATVKERTEMIEDGNPSARIDKIGMDQWGRYSGLQNYGSTTTLGRADTNIVYGDLQTLGIKQLDSFSAIPGNKNNILLQRDVFVLKQIRRVQEASLKFAGANGDITKEAEANGEIADVNIQMMEAFSPTNANGWWRTLRRGQKIKQFDMMKASDVDPQTSKTIDAYNALRLSGNPGGVPMVAPPANPTPFNASGASSYVPNPNGPGFINQQGEIRDSDAAADAGSLAPANIVQQTQTPSGNASTSIGSKLMTGLVVAAGVAQIVSLFRGGGLAGRIAGRAADATIGRPLGWIGRKMGMGGSGVPSADAVIDAHSVAAAAARENGGSIDAAGVSNALRNSGQFHEGHIPSLTSKVMGTDDFEASLKSEYAPKFSEINSRKGLSSAERTSAQDALRAEMNNRLLSGPEYGGGTIKAAHTRYYTTLRNAGYTEDTANRIAGLVLKDGHTGMSDASLLQMAKTSSWESVGTHPGTLAALAERNAPTFSGLQGAVSGASKLSRLGSIAKWGSVPFVSDLVDVGSTVAGGLSAGSGVKDSLSDKLLQDATGRVTGRGNTGWGDWLHNMSWSGMTSSLLGKDVTTMQDSFGRNDVAEQALWLQRRKKAFLASHPDGVKENHADDGGSDALHTAQQTTKSLDGTFTAIKTTLQSLPAAISDLNKSLATTNNEVADLRKQIKNNRLK